MSSVVGVEMIAARRGATWRTKERQTSGEVAEIVSKSSSTIAVATGSIGQLGRIDVWRD